MALPRLVPPPCCLLLVALPFLHFLTGCQTIVSAQSESTTQLTVVAPSTTTPEKTPTDDPAPTTTCQGPDRAALWAVLQNQTTRIDNLEDRLHALQPTKPAEIIVITMPSPVPVAPAPPPPAATTPSPVSVYAPISIAGDAIAATTAEPISPGQEPPLPIWLWAFGAAWTLGLTFAALAAVFFPAPALNAIEALSPKFASLRLFNNHDGEGFGPLQARLIQKGSSLHCYYRTLLKKITTIPEHESAYQEKKRIKLQDRVRKDLSDRMRYEDKLIFSRSSINLLAQTFICAAFYQSQNYHDGRELIIWTSFLLPNLAAQVGVGILISTNAAHDSLRNLRSFYYQILAANPDLSVSNPWERGRQVVGGHAGIRLVNYTFLFAWLFVGLLQLQKTFVLLGH